ncbi:DNA internalization-related competence protein ComEC/Rec2 [Staphylococcus pasteuri]|nr:DNA internalization-related competence protein ComEC/Rec2 [Staphylococcus pasteuri]
MFYIAISFLVGILWLFNKVLSTFILCMLMFLLIRKNVIKQYLFLVCISVLLSVLMLNLALTKHKQEMQNIKNSKHINEAVTFIKLNKESNIYKGLLEWHDHNVKFYYRHQGDYNRLNIDNYRCAINGDLQLLNSNQPIIFIKQIDLNSCTQNKKINPIAKHQSYIQNQMSKTKNVYHDRLLALITGDTSTLNQSFIDDVKEIGIYHLLAVSGSHVAAIIYLVHSAFVRLNTPYLLIKLLLLLILPLYAFYTDFAPSAVRSILVGIIILILPRQFKSKPLNILSFIFILMYFINPLIVFDIGFQFSFFISFFLIISTPLLKELTGLKLLTSVTFIAQLGALIITVYHFNQIQWIGLVSNLIFVPLYSIIIFPLAIIFFFLSHFTTHLLLLNTVINYSYRIHDQFLSLFLSLKYIRIFVPELNTFSIVFLIMSMFISLFLFVNRNILTSVSIIFLSIIIIIYTTRPSETELTMLDVGQGDSILFHTEYNLNIMIDTGGKLTDSHTKSNNNIAKYKILPSLKAKGISTIDYLIITHPHLDYMGELLYISNHINIKNIIIEPSSYPKDVLANIKSICQLNGINFMDINLLNSLAIKDGKLEFLDTYIQESDDKNEHSIVTLLKYKNKTILLTGDMTINNEELLLNRYQLPKIDILKVAHHGSKTSNSANLIQHITPKISLISSGKGNKYHLPNQEVITRLRQSGSKVLDTQINGEITVKLDSNLSISTKQQK